MAWVWRYRPAEFVRFYQAAIVNTIFGYGLYALLISMGVGMYPAQLIASVSGAAFNYLTYSRHAFRNAAPAKLRFVAAYVLNYLVNLGLLVILKRRLTSPYMIGVLVMVGASTINYVALRYMVFARRRPA